MNSIYIYHHLGMGDHIIANGYVRTYAKEYDKVYLFCKPRNFKNVSFMYRDLYPKIQLIIMEDKDVVNFINMFPNNNYLVVGFKQYYDIAYAPNNKLHIDEIFYKLANVPFENKRKEFFVLRDIKREKEVFAELGLHEGDEYAFVHEDHRKLTRNIPKMKIIKSDMKYSLFDYLYTIENATEIHVLNSSFFCLIDCLGINKDNMYLHQYCEPGLDWQLTGIVTDKWIYLRDE